MQILKKNIPFKPDQIQHPNLVQLSKTLHENHRFACDIVDRAAAIFGEPWADEFEPVLNALFPSKQSVISAAKGYATFAMHSMRLQAVFDREHQYKAKTHEQASREVYFNEDYMMEEYLPGLLLSHFLWPHHFRQLQFFDNAFVQAMRVSGARSFLEVGIGTGLYSSLLLRKLPEIRGMGIDISPSSKKFTEMQLQALCISSRYEVELRDVTANPVEPKSDWLVCVELLEHLDDPVAFLHGLRNNMSSGAKAFITAAINAAHADHIYLYRNSEEVLVQLCEAGFSLEQSFVASAYKHSESGIPVPQVVAFIVY